MCCRLIVPWVHVTIACHVTVLTSLELVTSCLLGLWIDFRILKFLKLKSQKFANIKDTLLNVHLSLFLHYEHVHIIGLMASCQMIMFMSILTLLPAGKDVKTLSKNYDHHFHSEIINLSNTVYMYIFQPASGWCIGSKVGQMESLLLLLDRKDVGWLYNIYMQKVSC